MKKVLKFFLWINAAALFILNLSVSLNLVDINSIKLTLKQEQALADDCGGGQNQATCYSTYTTGWMPPLYKIWRCGDCIRIENVKTMSDPGICYF